MAQNTPQPHISVPEGTVYLDYDVSSPPPHPGAPYTRFVCISDTHGAAFAVPDGDVLLHSGDLCNFGKDDELKTSAEWLYSLPHKIKIVIAGNHEFSLDPNISERWTRPTPDRFAAARNLLTGVKAKAAHITYLHNSSTEIQPKPGGRTWKVYGTPSSTWFYGMAFMYKEEDAESIIGPIPADTDILLTHGPAHGVLDLTSTDVSAGCKTLRAHLENRLRPALHLVGHIHEGYGALARELPGGGTTIHVNASNFPDGPRADALVAEGLKPTTGGPNFLPVIVDLLNETK